MQTPSAPAMLGAWERGGGQNPIDRGLTLLALACPELSADELAALSIGERDRRLLALRETVFGPRMTGVVACTRCAEPLEFDFDAADLRVTGTPGPLALRVDGYELELRLPDSRDLLACAATVPADAPAALMQRCVLSARIDGVAANAASLPPELVQEAAQCLAQADPQADMRFALQCASCGHSWKAPFDIVRFLWAELEVWAVRMLQDVHALAGAYGWAERDILALGSTRRRHYLRMLNA
ncbi:MAG: hypothetical protein P4L83_05005 [Nevskia sp.]|nr:hypothetical protein [Nevskia sp.]